MTNEQINEAIAELVNGDNEGPFPDYCNDLNAMHEAVTTLPENKRVLYGVRLAWECGHTGKKSVGCFKHLSFLDILSSSLPPLSSLPFLPSPFLLLA